MDDYDRSAMVLGVVLFALAMVGVTSTNRFYRFSRRPFVRRTLYIGYGLRLFASVIFPIGMTTDFPTGLMISAAVDNLFDLFDHPYWFLQTLLITLLQGTALNIILSVVMLAIWGVQRIFIQPKQINSTACAKCGYDLIASPQDHPCPECGSTAGHFNFDTTPLSKAPGWLLALTVIGLVLLTTLIVMATIPPF